MNWKRKCVVHARSEAPAVDLHVTILLMMIPKTTFYDVVPAGTMSTKVTMIAILASPKITSLVMVTERTLHRK